MKTFKRQQVFTFSLFFQLICLYFQMIYICAINWIIIRYKIWFLYILKCMFQTIYYIFFYNIYSFFTHFNILIRPYGIGTLVQVSIIISLHE